MRLPFVARTGVNQILQMMFRLSETQHALTRPKPATKAGGSYREEQDLLTKSGRSSLPNQVPTIQGSDRVIAILLGVLARLMLSLRRKAEFNADTIRHAQSFLLIRPEGLGDIILTLPAVSYLRRENPEGRIAMVVRPGFAQFVRDMQVVDEVIALDYPKRSTLALSQLNSFVRQFVVLRRRFDVAFEFRGDPRNAIIGAWSAPIVVGPGAPGTTFLLSAVYRDMKPRPMAERILGIVSLQQSSVPVVENYAAFRYRVDSHAVQRVAALLESRQNFVLIHPGASRPSNRWDPSKWRELIVKLLASGEEVVITGAGAEDLRFVSAIVGGLESRAGLLNLVNRTTCTDLTAIVERAKLVISPDTGIAHIAFARQVPSVTLFGSDSEVLWGHETSVNRPLLVRLPCRPCMAYHCPRSDHPMECMDRIKVDEVYTKAKMGLLSSSRAIDPIGSNTP